MIIDRNPQRKFFPVNRTIGDKKRTFSTIIVNFHATYACLINIIFYFIQVAMYTNSKNKSNSAIIKSKHVSTLIVEKS